MDLIDFAMHWAGAVFKGELSSILFFFLFSFSLEGSCPTSLLCARRDPLRGVTSSKRFKWLQKKSNALSHTYPIFYTPSQCKTQRFQSTQNRKKNLPSSPPPSLLRQVSITSHLTCNRNAPRTAPLLSLRPPPRSALSRAAPPPPRLFCLFHYNVPASGSPRPHCRPR